MLPRGRGNCIELACKFPEAEACSPQATNRGRAQAVLSNAPPLHSEAPENNDPPRLRSRIARSIRPRPSAFPPVAAILKRLLLESVGCSRFDLRKQLCPTPEAAPRPAARRSRRSWPFEHPRDGASLPAQDYQEGLASRRASPPG